MVYNTDKVIFQMSDGTTEQLKKFIFSSKCNSSGEKEELEIVIPEVFFIFRLLLFSFALCSKNWVG